MVVFCFSPPRCVPTCVVFSEFFHTTQAICPPPFYMKKHTLLRRGVFFCSQTLQQHSILPEDPDPRSTKQLYLHVSAYINVIVLNPMSDTPNPHPATSNPKNL